MSEEPGHRDGFNTRQANSQQQQHVDLDTLYKAMVNGAPYQTNDFPLDTYKAGPFSSDTHNLTPLSSPAFTPSMDFQNMSMSSREHFSPLTSPALAPHPYSQPHYDPLSNVGPFFPQPAFNQQFYSHDPTILSQLHSPQLRGALPPPLIASKKPKKPSRSPSPYNLPKKKDTFSPIPNHLDQSFTFILPDGASVLSPGMHPQLLPPSHVGHFTPLSDGQLVSPVLYPVTPSQLMQENFRHDYAGTDNFEGLEDDKEDPEKKAFHRESEQKRRDSLKHNFEELRKTLPPTEKSCSKLQLIKRSCQYINEFRIRDQKNEATIKSLREKLRQYEH